MFVFHGFGEHAGRYKRFAHELNNHGFAVFSLDMQGSRRNPADDDEGDDDRGGPLRAALLELTTGVCVGVPTGHGKSAGKRGYVGRYEDYVRDACDFISKVPGVYLQLPKFLVGFVSPVRLNLRAFSSDGPLNVLFRFSSDVANLHFGRKTTKYNQTERASELPSST